MTYLPGGVDEPGDDLKASDALARAQGSGHAHAVGVSRSKSVAAAGGKSVPLSGLFAHVWEHNGRWEVTHQFNVGLELDCGSHARAEEQGHRVHLPALSLHAVQHLRTSLQSPGAFALDVQASPGWGALAEVHAVLLSHFSRDLTQEQVVDVRSKLSERIRSSKADKLRPVAEMAPWDSEGSAVFVQPEEGRDAVDISVCVTGDTEDGGAPVVGLARLASSIAAEVHGQTVSVKYVAIILCPENLARHASKLGEALATCFMDEEFVNTVCCVTSSCSQTLLGAYDKHLSNLTIVPTVSMQDSEHPTRSLSDTIVTGIERMISESRGLGSSEVHPRSICSGEEEDPSPVASVKCTHFYVEVDELVGGSDRWKMTHRLHHGLEQDGKTKVHLPNVAVTALAQLWKIIKPSHIALDVSADGPVTAINSVVELLRGSDVPALAIDHVLRSLMDRVVDCGMGGMGRTLSKESEKSENIEQSPDAVMRPFQDDEACHLLAITSKHLPTGQPIIGAFTRLQAPLSFRLPPTDAMARFVWVFLGPEGSQGQLTTLVDSVAALASDEALMGSLRKVKNVSNFIDAFDQHLNNLSVIPRVRVRPKGSSVACPKSTPSTASTKHDTLSGEHDFGHGNGREEESEDSFRQSGFLGKFHRARRETTRVLQKYSLPLISGVSVALVWANTDAESYAEFIDASLTGDHTIWDHTISLHFIVNDIFMCFFFGLAIKEVTEALLPGGSLNPIRRAINPLTATLGGVVGPAIAYMTMILIFWSSGSFEDKQCMQPASASSGGHRRLGGGGAAAGPMADCDLGMLLKGWGVPTATDISLAWMFSLLIFGIGHPAINFLLLLAIVDDALGMVIIAVCYPDPANPVEPQWLLLVLAGAVLALAFRKCKVPFWSVYVFVCGPFAWAGLLLAHVHPALALCFIVPFIPADHAQEVEDFNAPDLGKNDWGHAAAEKKKQDAAAAKQKARTSKKLSLTEPTVKHVDNDHDHEWMHNAPRIFKSITQVLHEWDEAPLHVLESQLKLPVDLGMFFFGLCNAGVKLDNTGSVTVSVLFALIVGKMFGIACFSLLAAKLGFPIPPGITIVDLFSMSALGGVGLTVALFVANEAFVDPGMKGQAKFAAVLSVCGAGVAWLIRKLGNMCLKPEDEDDDDTEVLPADDVESQGNYLDVMMAEEVMKMLWLQRKYNARGVNVDMQTLQNMSRKSSKRNSESMPSPAASSAGGPMTPDMFGAAFERSEIRRSATSKSSVPPQPDVLTAENVSHG